MRRRPVALFGAMLLACAAVTVSCSDDNNDVVGKACSVVVHKCNAMSNMSACIDVVGDLSPSCVNCIASGGCDYFSDCQRADASCIMSPELKP